MDPVRYLKALWRDPSVRAGLALSLGMTTPPKHHDFIDFFEATCLNRRL